MKNIVFVIDTTFDNGLEEKAKHINNLSSLSNLSALNCTMLVIDYILDLKEIDDLRELIDPLVLSKVIFKHFEISESINYIHDMLLLLFNMCENNEINKEEMYFMYLGCSGRFLPNSKFEFSKAFKISEVEDSISSVPVEDIEADNFIFYKEHNKLITNDASAADIVTISAEEGFSRYIFKYTIIDELLSMSTSNLINHRFNIFWWPVLLGCETFYELKKIKNTNLNDRTFLELLVGNFSFIDYKNEFLYNDPSKLTWFKLLAVFEYVRLVFFDPDQEPKVENYKDNVIGRYEAYTSGHETPRVFIDYYDSIENKEHIIDTYNKLYEYDVLKKSDFSQESNIIFNYKI